MAPNILTELYFHSIQHLIICDYIYFIFLSSTHLMIYINVDNNLILFQIISENLQINNFKINIKNNIISSAHYSDTCRQRIQEIQEIITLKVNKIFCFFECKYKQV